MEPTGRWAQSDTEAENACILGEWYHISAASAILHYPFHPSFDITRLYPLFRTIQSSIAAQQTASTLLFYNSVIFRALPAPPLPPLLFFTL